MGRDDPLPTASRTAVRYDHARSLRDTLRPRQGHLAGLARAIRFTPRKPGSVWAESNKARVARMIEQGRMTEAGMALVRDGRKSGEWDKAAEREDTDSLPPDLEAALAENEQARRNFLAFPPSSRRQYLYWVTEAKREETRSRRIAEVVKRAEENRKTWN